MGPGEEARWGQLSRPSPGDCGSSAGRPGAWLFKAVQVVLMITLPKAWVWETCLPLGRSWDWVRDTDSGHFLSTPPRQASIVMIHILQMKQQSPFIHLSAVSWIISGQEVTMFLRPQAFLRPISTTNLSPSNCTCT